MCGGGGGALAVGNPISPGATWQLKTITPLKISTRSQIKKKKTHNKKQTEEEADVDLVC